MHVDVVSELRISTSFSERIVGRLRDRFVPSFTGQSQSRSTSQGDTDDSRSDVYLSYVR